MSVFTKFFATRINQHRNVQIVGYCHPKHLLQIDLPRSGIEQIAPPHDFGDRLFVVIGNNGKLIRKHVVAAAYDKIARFLAQMMVHRAMQTVNIRYMGVTGPNS